MNFSSHCSQIYCLALQFLPSLLMFTLNSHFIFTFTFWVPCWSGWINIKSFSFPSDQLIEFSRLEDVGCLECLYQMHRLVYTSIRCYISTKSLLSSLSSIWFQENEKNFKTAVRVEFWAGRVLPDKRLFIHPWNIHMLGGITSILCGWLYYIALAIYKLHFMPW